MTNEDAGELEEPENGQETAEAPPPDPIAQRDRRIEELTDDLKRLQAEFENYKKRALKEGAERSRIGVETVLRDLLAVLDTLDKALDDAARNEYPGPLRKGLEGISKQLTQTLQRQGLREVRTDGRFDPFEQEAVQREERDDIDEGNVIEVYQKGYAVGPKVIRTAKVKVSVRRHAPDEDQDNQESQPDMRGE